MNPDMARENTIAISVRPSPTSTLTGLRRLNSTIPGPHVLDLGELWIKSGLGG